MYIYASLWYCTNWIISRPEFSKVYKKEKDKNLNKSTPVQSSSL